MTVTGRRAVAFQSPPQHNIENTGVWLVGAGQGRAHTPSKFTWEAWDPPEMPPGLCLSPKITVSSWKIDPFQLMLKISSRPFGRKIVLFFSFLVMI